MNHPKNKTSLQGKNNMSKTTFDGIPHLTTTLKGPLHLIEQQLLSNQVGIESWIRQQLHLTPPPFYSSVDLRNAGYKIAPIDTNLYPAGFNNLNEDFIPLCIQAVQATLEQMAPKVSKILIIPEDHTRNIYYFENIFILYEILTNAGYEVRIGSLLAELRETKTVNLSEGRSIQLEPIIREEDKLKTSDFTPCLILLNNDLANGVPDILKNLKQTIVPPISMGWHSRLKSDHFQLYEQIATEFAAEFNFDPWLFNPLFRYCGEVNFMSMEGETCMINHATQLFSEIRQKYKEYNITEPPFLVIKADAGTYGMAVMTIKDPEELKNLNRKERTRMAFTKGGRDVTQVLLQEGVYTFETWGEENAVAEPVVYMIGKHVIGGFYRVHAGKGQTDNLNTPGMNFKPLAFKTSCNIPNKNSDSCVNRFYVYGVIARLALLAAARELTQVNKS